MGDWLLSLSPSLPWYVEDDCLEEEGEANPLVVLVVLLLLVLPDLRLGQHPGVGGVHPNLQ